MLNKKKVSEYLEENPELLDGNYGHTAKILNVSYDAVRSAARRLKESLKRQAPQKQSLLDKDLKGVLTKAKTWQLPNGEWRESLTFQVDYAEQWDGYKKEFLDATEAIGGKIFKGLKSVKPKGEVCLEISFPDLHFGKGDIEQIANRFIEGALELLEKSKPFGIERVLLPVGNDGLNSEGKRYTTTGGTPQDDSVDWRTSFRHYWATLAATITNIAAEYPVDVLVIPGNHDTERMFYIGDVLSAYFKDNPSVDVQNSGEYRTYYEYGTNMILFTHGDKEKVADLPLIMATEQPEMFARTKYREVHMGHLHKEKVNEYRGIKTRFLPSICPTDEWHKMMGYANQKAGQAFLWNRNSGLEGYFQKNFFD
jgi:hypothetical protein